MKLKINKSSALNDLIRECRKHNGRAQRELFDRYASRFLGICRRYAGNIKDAEDIMIGGFMKIFERIGQYSGDGSFEGWMTRIMINESLTFIRRNKNMSVEVSLEMAESTHDYSAVVEGLDMEHLLKLIDDMPVGYRTVFNLHVVEGYAHREIAGLLNISEGASKSQLSRAKLYLREKIFLLEKESKNSQNEK